ncbi:MAG: GAF domain-containing protein, partial [Candidatus Omnitrophica bacterium]|nr:GAF domain-containing protein [Candidatus Omnitrophota bacterium]
MIDYRVVVLLLMAAIFSCLWLFVLVSGHRQLINKIYSIFVGNMALWAFGLAMFYYEQELPRVLLWADFLYVAGSLIASAFLHFSFVFPSGQLSISRTKQMLIYLPNVVLAVLFFFTPFIIKDVFINNSVRGYIYGPGHMLWDLQFDTAFSLGFWRFIKAYRTSSGVNRNRLKYILLGTSLGVLLAGTTNVIMPWLGRFELIWTAPLLTSTWLISIIYAISRFRLLDVKIAAIRTVIAVLIFGGILIWPWWICYRLQDWLVMERRSYWWGMAAAVDIAFVIAFYAKTIYHYFHTGAEKPLLKEEKSYLKALEDTSSELPLIKDLDRLMETIVMSIVNNVGIANAALYLKNQEGYHLGYAVGDGKEPLPKGITASAPLIEELFVKKGPVLREEIQDRPVIYQQVSTMKVSVVIPCLLKGELLGFLALGEKTSGKSYHPEDLKAFQGLAVPLSLAMENAGYLKQLEALHSQALEGAKFRSIRQMMNAMGHELGNLMMVACGKSQILLIAKEKHQFSEEVVEMLKAINERGMVASEILKEVNDYHKKSTKKEIVEFDIAQTIEKSL